MIFEIKTTISFRPPAGHCDCDRGHSHCRVIGVASQSHRVSQKYGHTLSHFFKWINIEK